jgi:phospholipid transport system substrate-binding protein
MLATFAVLVSLSAAPVGPTATVRAGNEEMRKLLEAGSNVEKLAAKADDFIDFGELAKRALGKKWDELKAKQQAEFAATMKGLLRASYAQKAVREGKSESNTVYGAEKATANEATVETSLVVGKDKFPVQYRLYRKDAKSAWRIYDVVTDDVSLLTTYSDQFNQLLPKKGYEGLLATLKNRRDQLEKDNASRTN